MSQAPTPFQTILWLVIAVWLLTGWAYLFGLPSNVVVAMLILGTAAAVTEWLVSDDARACKRTRSRPPVSPSKKISPGKKPR